MPVIASGTISATGPQAAFTPRASFDARYPGVAADNAAAVALGVRGAFSGSIAVERSLDGGSVWGVVSRDSAGTPAVYTAAFDILMDMLPRDVQYRLNVTALSSGTPTWQASVG